MSRATQDSEATRGAIAAAAGFLCWGIVPIYWKQLAAVPALELIAHRIVWSLLFLLVVQAWRGRLGALREGFASVRLVGLNLLSSVLLAVNWTVYVWGVNSGHVIECSLGYFLTPLGNVALGYVFLHERLRPAQWTAIAFAAAGVLLLLWRLGHFPWIALSLAGTWSCYAILKKRSALGPMNGLTVETVLLFPAALAALLWWHADGQGALGRVDGWQHTLILSAGIITAVPLLLFAQGAQRVRLSTLGLLQYLSPSVQFLLGVFLYHESFDATRLQAFALIWAGLFIYTGDGFWSQRRKLFT